MKKVFDGGPRAPIKASVAEGSSSLWHTALLRQNRKRNRVKNLLPQPNLNINAQLIDTTRVSCLNFGNAGVANTLQGKHSEIILDLTKSAMCCGDGPVAQCNQTAAATSFDLECSCRKRHGRLRNVDQVLTAESLIMFASFLTSFIPSLVAFAAGLLIAWLAWGWGRASKD